MSFVTANTRFILPLLLLLHPFNGLFSRTTWVIQYQKGKTSLDLNEARDDGLLGCSGISWTICKQSAPRSRQITTPTRHHSFFIGRMLFLMPSQQCQSTESLSSRFKLREKQVLQFSSTVFPTMSPYHCKILSCFMPFYAVARNLLFGRAKGLLLHCFSHVIV